MHICEMCLWIYLFCLSECLVKDLGKLLKTCGFKHTFACADALHLKWSFVLNKALKTFIPQLIEFSTRKRATLG